MLQNGTLIIDRYRILEFLGDGSFGEVYKVFDSVYARIAAVKIIRHKVSESAQEAISLAKSAHPNVIKVNNFVGLSDMAIIEMPLAEGGNLQRKLADWGPLPLEVAGNFLQQMGHGLDYIHANKIIHNDFKPLNVLLFQPDQRPADQPPVYWDWRLQLCDFGLARMIQEGQSYLQSKSIGTLVYCAPEEFEEEIRLEGDIYALGITLFQMLTGDLPFRGTPGQIMYAHQHKPLPSVVSYRQDISPEIDQLLALACAKEPRQRLKSGQELTARYRDILTRSDLTGYKLPTRLHPTAYQTPEFAGTPSLLPHTQQLIRLQSTALAPIDLLTTARQAVRVLVEKLNGQPRRGIPVVLQLSPDNSYLVFGCDQSHFDLGWVQPNPELVAELHRVAFDGKLSALVFEPEGAKIVIGTQTGLVEVWNLAAGFLATSTRRLEHHKGTVSTLWFTPGGTLFSGGYDGQLLRWDGQLAQATLILRRDARLLALVGLFSAEADYRLVSAWDDGTVQICNEQGEQLTELLTNAAFPNGLWLAVAPGGLWLAAGDPDGLLSLWRNHKGGFLAPQIRALPNTSASLTALAFAPDGDRLAAGFSDGTLYWTTLEGANSFDWQILSSDYRSAEALRPAVRLLNWLLPDGLLVVYYDGKLVLEKI